MRINFILNSINDAHSIKRVADFRNQGVEVKVYGFLRNNERSKDPDAVVLGTFSNALGYRKRMGIYYRGIKKLFREQRNLEDLWFYLGLDVAMFAMLVDPHRKYIYEECDLVHTYIANKTMQRVMERIDKTIIKRSQKTLVTSEGFLDFHYGSGNIPSNIVVVPNKLTQDILRFDPPTSHQPDASHLRFAFVGGIRYHSLLSIADMIGKHFPQHEFHFHGFVAPTIPKTDLPRRPNIVYHGRYKSPDDLSRIYSDVDVLICTYDTKEKNVQFAEPNKLYEALYFSCPIVVSAQTFLAKQVERMGIGYSVDAFSEPDVVALVRRIENEVVEKRKGMEYMDKSVAIDDNSYINELFH